jgi:hypothetical protein
VTRSCNIRNQTYGVEVYDKRNQSMNECGGGIMIYHNLVIADERQCSVGRVSSRGRWGALTGPVSRPL